MENIRATRKEASSGCSPSARRLRILIMEDNFIAAMDLGSMLAEHGHEIVGMAATGPEAVALARAERPDLVFADIRLAKQTDGVEAARLIQRELGIRSIFISAHIDAQTRFRAAAANPIGWMEKPFTPDRLHAALAVARMAFPQNR